MQLYQTDIIKHCDQQHINYVIRAKTIRWRLYAMAAKVVKTGRQIFVKVQAQHQALLEQVLTAMRQFEPPPG